MNNKHQWKGEKISSLVKFQNKCKHELHQNLYLWRVVMCSKSCEVAYPYIQGYKAPSYLQLPLRQWGAGNVYLLVLSKAKR